jgi:hypothetical protein
MTDEHITSFTNSFDELGALAVLDRIKGGFAIGIEELLRATLRAVMEPLGDMSQAVFADKSTAGTRGDIVEKNDDEESLITGVKEMSKPISISVRSLLALSNNRGFGKLIHAHMPVSQVLGLNVHL